MSEPFAKLFDTPHGQLLAYLDDDEEERPSIRVIGAYVRGVRPAANLGYDDDDAQRRGFEKFDQEMANGTAADFFRLVAGLAT